MNEVWEGTVPINFWRNNTNLCRYMDWLGAKLGYDQPEHWYQVKQRDFIRNHGTGLLDAYKGSPFRILSAYLPNYDWKGWLFSKTPQGFWKDAHNVTQYLDWLGSQLGFRQEQDWYQATQNILNKHCGSLLHLYQGSPYKLMRAYKPTYDWKEWLFRQVSPNFWTEQSNFTKYMDWLGTILGYTHLDNWYNITANDFRKHRGGGLLRLFYSPILIVMKYKPDYPWQIEKFTIGLKKQKRIYAIIKNRFPNTPVLFNYWHPNLRFSDTNHRMQLDIYLPELMLAIEYHGEQHFKAMEHWGGIKALDFAKRHDAEKRRACAKHNINLIEIDCTWTGDENFILEKVEKYA